MNLYLVLLSFLIASGATAKSPHEFSGFKIVYLSDFGPKDISYQKVLFDELKELQFIAKNKILQKDLEAQKIEKLTADDIQTRDSEWKKSLGITSFKKSLMDRRSSNLFRVLLSKKFFGRYAEIFLTDVQGANVALFPLTSDYWQGDEAKFIQSYNKGSCGIAISGSKYDESADSRSFQVSYPVVNKYNRCIGILVVGIKELYLRQRMEQGKTDKPGPEPG